jgi:hypothetical protein
MRHFPWRECGYAIVVLVVLTGLYVGSYFSVVSSSVSLTIKTDPGSPKGWGWAKCIYFRYRSNWQWMEPFFTPLQQIEARIRDADQVTYDPNAFLYLPVSGGIRLEPSSE